MEIIDNFMSKEESDKLENLLLGNNFPWFFESATCYGDDMNKLFIQNEFTQDTPQFSHVFYINGKINSSFFIETMSIIDKLEKIKSKTYKNRINRIKANLIYKDSLYPDNHYHFPHRDDKNDVETLLYYVNNTDGDTFIFNEKVENISISNIKLTINKRVTPKKGTGLFFDSKYLHASSVPRKNNTRVVLNIVFDKE